MRVSSVIDGYWQGSPLSKLGAFDYSTNFCSYYLWLLSALNELPTPDTRLAPSLLSEKYLPGRSI